jgi:hypothetical protein
MLVRFVDTNIYQIGIQKALVNVKKLLTYIRHTRSIH